MLKLRYIVRFLLGLLLAVTTLFVWLEYKRSNEIKALVDLGFPVTPEAMLKFYGEVPDDENAWVLLDGLTEQFQYPEELMPNVPIVGESDWGCDDNIPMPQEVRSASEAVLALNADLLDRIHEAASRPYMRIPGKVTEEGYLNVVECETAGMLELNTIFSFLEFQAYCAIENKDYLLLAKVVLSILRLEILEGQQPSTNPHISPNSTRDGFQQHLLPKLLQSHAVPEQTLQMLMETLLKCEEQTSYSHFFVWRITSNELFCINGKSLYSLETDRLFNELVLFDDLNAIKQILLTPFENLSFRYTLFFQYYNLALKFDKQHPIFYRDCQETLDAIHTSYVFSLAPAGTHLFSQIDEYEILFYFKNLAVRRFLQLAISLELFNIKHGHYPSALTELQPDFFDALPVVPVEDTDWEYTLDSKGCNLRYGIDFFRREDLTITLSDS